MDHPNGAPTRLEVVAGPALPAIELDGPGPGALSLGRSTTSHVVLADPDGTVSRRHAELVRLSDRWWIADRDSKHGTFVNGHRLVPGKLTALVEGDRLRIGPWTFRVAGRGAAPATVAPATDDRPSPGVTLHRYSTHERDISSRLESLVVLATELGAAEDELGVAGAAVRAMLAGTGYARAAYVRVAGEGESVEIVAHTPDQRPAPLSRSLLDGAGEGEAVVLSMRAPEEIGQSVNTLGIMGGVCAPVMIDGVPDAYLYADWRISEERPALGMGPDETAAFGRAVARLCELALAAIHRRRLARDDARRREELEAARDVQRIIMPPASGAFEGAGARLSYEVHCSPGRFVAGDLFDCFRIDEHRVGVFLGDVVGKGIAAGMIMANVQAHLVRLLGIRGDPAAALSEVSHLVAGYSRRWSEEGGERALFLSLWAGVIDLRTGSLIYVDAGHGYAIMRHATGDTHRELAGGGPPLGVVADFPYVAEHAQLHAGSRLYLYSDGLCEQKSAAGEAFGVDGVLACVGSSRTPGEDVVVVLTRLRAFAGIEAGFADDVTFAALAFERGG